MGVTKFPNGVGTSDTNYLGNDGSLTLDGTTITAAEIQALGGTGLSAAELGVLDGVTAGTVTAEKALVVDANKDLSIARYVSAEGFYAGASGTAGVIDVYPSTAASGKLSVSIADQAGDTSVNLYVPSCGQATTFNFRDPGAATTYMVTSTAAITPAEADTLDGAVAGTQAASKVVLPDSNVNIGVTKVTELHVGASGSEIQVLASQPAAIADYTITWTANAPTPGDSNTIDDGTTVGDDNEGGQAIADLTAKVNAILAALRTTGIIAT
jgi:hypothetical protein